MKRFAVAVLGLGWLAVQQPCGAQKSFSSTWSVRELKSRAERAEINQLLQEKRKEWSLREDSALARRVQKMAEKGTRARVQTILSPDKKRFLRIAGYIPKDSYHAGIYDARNGKLLRRLPSPRPEDECGGAMDGQWSPDGNFVSFCEVENDSRLFFDMRTGRGVAGSSPSAIFAPDSKHIVDLNRESPTNKCRLVLRSLQARHDAGHSALIPIRDQPVLL